MARFIKLPILRQRGFLLVNADKIEKVIVGTKDEGASTVRMYGKIGREIATSFFESKEDALSFIEKNFILFNA